MFKIFDPGRKSAGDDWQGRLYSKVICRLDIRRVLTGKYRSSMNSLALGDLGDPSDRSERFTRSTITYTCMGVCSSSERDPRTVAQYNSS